VATPVLEANQDLSDRTLATSARARLRPLDLMLDLSSKRARDPLRSQAKDADQERAVIEQLIDHPWSLIGSSTRGTPAHLLRF